MAEDKPKKTNIGLIGGLAAGGLAIVGLVWWLLAGKKKDVDAPDPGLLPDVVVSDVPDNWIDAYDKYYPEVVALVKRFKVYYDKWKTAHPSYTDEEIYDAVTEWMIYNSYHGADGIKRTAPYTLTVQGKKIY